MQFHQCRIIINSLSPWLVQIRRDYTQTAAPVQKFIQSSVITSVLVVCGYSQKVDRQSLNLPRQGQSAGTGAQYSTCKEIVISILLVQLSITMLSTSYYILLIASTQNRYINCIWEPNLNYQTRFNQLFKTDFVSKILS